MKLRRIFTILIAACVIVSMVPAAAFADTRVAIRGGIDPPEGGSVTGDAYYNIGDQVTFTAHPANGYSFEYFYDADTGDILSWVNPYSFTAQKNVTIVAAFRKDGEYFISSPDFASSPTSHTEGTMTVFPYKTSYAPGSVVTLSATARSGYRFDHFEWAEDIGQGSGGLDYTKIDGNQFTMPACDVYILAIFYSTTPHTITISSDSNGSVLLDPQKTYYYQGEEVTMTFKPNSGYQFSSFEGLLPYGSEYIAFNTWRFTMPDEDLNYAVHYEEKQTAYVIVGVSPYNECGTAWIASSDDSTGAITVQAEAKEGMQFSHWFYYDNGQASDPLSTDNPYTFVPPAGNHMMVAAFTTVDPHVLYSANVTNGSFTVTPLMPGSLYGTGQIVTVDTAPNDGYVLDYIAIGRVEGSSIKDLVRLDGNTFDMPAYDAGVVVRFARLDNVTVSASAGGSASGGGEFKEGTVVTVTAEPESGYRFVNWTEGGNPVSTNQTYNFYISGDRNLVANFEIIPVSHAITISAEPTEGGRVTGSGTYDQGSTATVTATVNRGYAFVNWTEGGSAVSTEASYSFTVTEARELVAHFVEVPIPTYEISVNAGAGGSAAGSGTFEEGLQATVTATPNNAYRFVNWTEGGNVVSTAAKYSFTVTGARQLTANFELIPTYTISVSADPAAGGSVSGGGTYEEGGSVTLTASPAGGCDFISWTEGGNVVSTDASYTFTVSGARTLVANFTAPPVAHTSHAASGPGAHTGWKVLSTDSNGKLKINGSDCRTVNDHFTDYYVLDTGSYYLESSITPNMPIFISGSDVDLCLNGYSIQPSHSGDRVIHIYDAYKGENSKLRLYDVSGNTGKIDGMNACEESVSVSSSTSSVSTVFEMYGGTITGATYAGLTTHNWGAVTRLFGGNITNNSGKYGGVVLSDGGCLIMDGGSINNNTAGWYDHSGGGVYLSGGRFTMNGGIISNNSAEKGGGVYVGTQYGSSTFTMNGGTITGNTASYGGGVYIRESIYGTRSFTINGGTISGNSATVKGGGVYNGDKIIVSGSADITGNTTAGSSDNVYLTNGKVINVSGALTNSARIGVLMEAPGIITNGLSGNGTIARFSSDAGDTMGTNDAGEAAFPVTVTITAGDNMSKTAESGALVQTLLAGNAIDAVAFLAGDEYFFPADYAVDPVNGVTVTRDDYDQITVSGAPTAASEVALTAPTMKGSEATPAAMFTATGEDSGRLTGLAANAEYILAGAGVPENTMISADANGEYSFDSGLRAGTLSVIKKGDGVFTLNSEAQGITITSAVHIELIASQPSTIGGKGSIPTTEIHEKHREGSNWTNCSGAWNNLYPGTYYVRVKASGSALASPTQTIVIKEFIAEQEATPAAIFTATGIDSGTLSNLSPGAIYVVGGAGLGTNRQITADGSGNYCFDSGLSAGTLSVVGKGNGTTTRDSDAQTILVLKGSTPQLLATQPEVINGTGSIPTTTAYQTSSDGTNWTDATGAWNGLAPGTYYIRVKANGAVLTSDAQTLTITAFDPNSEPVPSAAFNASGADCGTLSGLAAGVSYALSGAGVAENTVITADASGNIEMASGMTAGDLAVVRKGNTTTTLDSGAQTITISKPDAPADLQAGRCTVPSDDNGTIAGMSDTMEYRFGDGEWNDAVNGTLTDLQGGTYFVRYKGNGAALASEPVAVDVGHFVPPQEEPVNEIHSGDSVTVAELERLIEEGQPLTVVTEDGMKVVVEPEILKEIVEKAEDGSVTIELGADVAEAAAAAADAAGADGTPEEVKVVRFAVSEDGGTFVLACEPFPFDDVPEESYYYDAVDWAALKGIVKGIDEDSFGPADLCKRDQVITFLWRAAGCPVPEGAEEGFDDLDADAFYYKAVLWAAEQGVALGTGASFDPEGTVTRAQVVTFIWRAAGSPEPKGSESPFKDIDENAYYYKAVLWAAEEGIALGKGDGIFDPGAKCKRSEVVTFIYRAYTDLAE